MSFIKLKEISAFRVIKVEKSHWKGWSDKDSKFFVYDSYPKVKPEGMEVRKYWVLECSEGTLELSSAQFSQMLEGCFVLYNGTAEPKGKRFTVKNNGKQGKDIRYWINLCYDQSANEDDFKVEAQTETEPAPMVEPPVTTEEKKVEINNIPF